MWVGNFMLIILNLPLIGLWVKMLAIPPRILTPAILMFCIIGAYSMDNSTFDIWMTVPLAALGYLWRKLDCEPAPLLLGIVLGPLLEEHLRRAMILSRGSWGIFIEQPISCALLATAVVLLVLVALPAIRSQRERAFAE